MISVTKEKSFCNTEKRVLEKDHYSLSSFVDLFESKGVNFSCKGSEIEVDLDGTGHLSYKINPWKGVYLYTGSGNRKPYGRVESLFFSLGWRLPSSTERVELLSPANKNPSPDFSDTQKIAESRWKNGWTCTHIGDLPFDWDRGAKNVFLKGSLRAKYEKQGNILYTYLKNRLGEKHVLHWMRQIRIDKKTGAALSPMYIDGNFSGIQRTFFSEEGEKIERKTLGKLGSFLLHPNAEMEKQFLIKDRPIIFLAEGLETGAVLCQYTGWPTLVCYSNFGLVREAEKFAQKYLSLPENKKRKSPAFLVAVDVDHHKTMPGQVSAAKAVQILRNAGMEAYFVAPMTPEFGGPKGGKKGVDWADYQTEGLSHALLGHISLALQQSDNLLKNFLVREKKEQKESDFWKKMESPEPVQATEDVHFCRKKQKEKITEMLEYYQSRKSDEIFSPWLFEQTAGVGKTREIIDLPNHPLVKNKTFKIRVVVQNHEQAKSFCEKESQWKHCVGRQKGGEEYPEAECFAFDQMIEALEKNHTPQSEFCNQCKHYSSYMIEQCKERLHSGRLSEAEILLAKKTMDNHLEKLSSQGLVVKEVAPCPWQKHHQECKNSRFVVMVSNSYSEGIVGSEDLLITDEKFPLARTMKIRIEDIHFLAKRIKNIFSEEKIQKEEKDFQKICEDFFFEISHSMSKVIASGKNERLFLSEKVIQLSKYILLQKYEKIVKKVESLHFDSIGEIAENPIRAIQSIAKSVLYGEASLVDGRLCIAVVHPLLERMQKGYPMVCMDATPDNTLVKIIKQLQGFHIRLLAKQSIRIFRHPSRFWGSSALDERRFGKERKKKEIQKYQLLMKEFPGHAFLFHKKASVILSATSSLVDHWGRGHRSHNRWEGMPLVLVGGFYPEEESWETLYQQSRLAALSSGCPLDEWPTWDGQKEESCWISEGEYAVPVPVYLPKNNRLREWLLSSVCNETVQAIGRVRGVNQKNPIDVHIFGGFPLTTLGKYGLSVEEYQEDPESLGKPKVKRDKESREGSLLRVCQTAAVCIKNQVPLQRRTLSQVAQESTKPGNPEREDWYHQGRKKDSLPVPMHQDADTSLSSGGGSIHPRVYQEWMERLPDFPALASYFSGKGRSGSLLKDLRGSSIKGAHRAFLEVLDFLRFLFSSAEKASMETFSLGESLLELLLPFYAEKTFSPELFPIGYSPGSQT